MELVSAVHIGILSLLLGAQIFKRSLLASYGKRIFWYALALTALLLLYWSQQQFLAWAHAEGAAKYLVPPYQGISYFFIYVLFRIWGPYIISAGIALLVLWASKLANRRFEERFFYSEEPYLIALCVFAVGHPVWIAYLMVTIAAYCLYLLVRRALSGSTQRLTFYYFWTPIAIATLLALPLLRTTELFLKLKL